MLIRCYIREKIGINNRSYKCKIYVYTCDFCKKEFEGSSSRRFCSRKCQGAGRSDILTESVRRARRTKTVEEMNLWSKRIGASNKRTRENDKSISERALNTFKQKYGKTHTEYMNDVFYEKYGVNSPSKLLHVKEILSAAMKERHANNIIRDAVVKKHGVTNVMHIDSVVKKQRETTLKRHGVKCVLELQHVKDKSKTIEAHTKRHISMKNNGSYHKSKPEDFVHDALINLYGITNVDRQVLFAKRYHADFWIKSLNIFLQVDGIYWHGLETTIDLLQKSNSKQSKNIVLTMKNDQEQNAFFTCKTNNDNSSLLRISDRFVMKLIRTNPVLFLQKLQDLIEVTQRNKFHVQY